MKTGSLVVVIVNHDQDQQVREQLAAYYSDDPVLFARTRWVVVRNHGAASGFGSETDSAAVPPLSAVEVIACENRGYGAAVNRGAQHAQCPYVLASNADLIPQPGFLAGVHRLIGELDHPDRPRGRVGVAGFSLLNADLSVQGSVGRFPTLCRALLGLLRPRTMRKYIAMSVTNPTCVPWVTGACFLLSRQCLEEIGGFDERFFMYYEDVDLCRRAWRQNWNVLYDPRVAIRHLFPYHGRTLNHRMVAMARKSMLLYFKEHRPRWEFWLLQRIVLGDCAMRIWTATKDDRERWRAVKHEIRAYLQYQRKSSTSPCDEDLPLPGATRPRNR